MEKNVAIIGVGALGKRHLQSMIELSEEYKIYAVEVLPEVLDDLRKEFNERINFCSAISELPKELEAVVIATSSNVRRVVFEKLVAHCIVKRVVFEKVLFQRVEDYVAVKKILEDNNILAWINCARREWPSYQEFKKELADANTMSITITGGEWGLGCNGIHMLDLIQYLTGSRECIIKDVNLLEGIVPSKRKGFYEVHGSVSGSCGRCETFQIVCMKDSSLPLQINITTDRVRYQISEGKGKMFVSSAENEWSMEEREFHIKFQSQLTKKVIEEIVNDNKCELPDFQESMDLHLKFIEPLLNHFERCNMEVGLCPIT